ncbi:MAG TPA: DUF5714 domain-containing protein [Candidatus Aquicultor sp.]|jgi:hypothetical protein
MVCGEKLIYRARPELLTCYFCGQASAGTISCVNNHFVCDACHGQDALHAITTIAITTKLNDPIQIAEQMMSHPSVPMIGGEHHAIVAMSLTAALKSAGPVSYNDQELIINDDLIERALDRTWTDRVPSCMCANYGACGAALAAGVVMSLLTDATCDKPKGRERQIAMQTTNAATAKIASYMGTCCKLSTRLAIESACDAIKEHMGLSLPRTITKCQHQKRNPYKCLGAACPFSKPSGR